VRLVTWIDANSGAWAMGQRTASALSLVVI
jgi:hypothetical protein